MTEQEIENLFGPHSGKWFGLGTQFAPRKSVMYHYTSLISLMGILKSNQIWATNLNYLNDVTESSHIWSFLEARLRNIQASGERVTGLDLDKLIELVKHSHAQTAFVASFSESRDSLSQWRAYSSVNGVCLGFHEAALNTQWVSNPTGGEPHWTGMIPYKVLYLPSNDDDSLDVELRNLLKTGSPFPAISSSRTKEQDIIGWLQIMAVAFKHEAFKEELEWRLCYRRQGKPMRHQRFRIGKSMLIPYIAADLNVDTERRAIVDGSYLAEVIVGPSPNMELTKDAVEQLLESEGHQGVKVTLSNTPYRDW